MNIRYPIYEGVYRILTFVQSKPIDLGYYICEQETILIIFFRSLYRGLYRVFGRFEPERICG